MLETRPANEVWYGGSDARPTWKKRPVKMLKKNRPGSVVNKESKIVNVRDTGSNPHRVSFAAHSIPLRKVNDEGKEESNPILVIPFRLELW